MKATRFSSRRLSSLNLTIKHPEAHVTGSFLYHHSGSQKQIKRSTSSKQQLLHTTVPALRFIVKVETGHFLSASMSNASQQQVTRERSDSIHRRIPLDGRGGELVSSTRLLAQSRWHLMPAAYIRNEVSRPGCSRPGLSQQ